MEENNKKYEHESTINLIEEILRENYFKEPPLFDFGQKKLDKMTNNFSVIRDACEFIIYLCEQEMAFDGAEPPIELWQGFKVARTMLKQNLTEYESALRCLRSEMNEWQKACQTEKKKQRKGEN